LGLSSFSWLISYGIKVKPGKIKMISKIAVSAAGTRSGRGNEEGRRTKPTRRFFLSQPALFLNFP